MALALEFSCASGRCISGVLCGRATCNQSARYRSRIGFVHIFSVSRVGRDQRTPYKIALAATHTDVARLLKEKEQASNGTSGDSSPRNYAKGYLLGDLRKFSGWREENENSRELSDSDVVFLHQDFTVTQLIWPGENVIFNEDTPEWREFCSQQLQFKVPDDFDLIASTQQASSAGAA